MIVRDGNNGSRGDGEQLKDHGRKAAARKVATFQRKQQGSCKVLLVL